MSTNLPLPGDWRYEAMNQISPLINDAEFAYWTAALAFDSVVISVFTIALSLSTNRWLISAVVIVSLASAFLLVMNFHSRITSYRKIMKAIQESTPDSADKLTPLEEKRQSEYIAIERREGFVKYLFWLQFGLILLFLLPCM